MTLDFSKYIYAGLMSVAFGIDNALAKHGSRGLHKWAFLLLLTCPAIALFALYPSALSQFPYALPAAIVYIVALLSMYKALRIECAGIVMAFASLSTIVAVVISVIVYHYVLTPLQLAGAVLAVVGTCLLSLKNPLKVHFLHPDAILYSLMAALFFGFAVPLFSFASSHIGGLRASIDINIWLTLFALAGMHLDVKDELEGHPAKENIEMLFAGFFANLGMLFESFSFSSIGAAITSSFFPISTVITLIIEVLFDGEKVKPHQVLAILIICAGCAAVMLFGK